MGMDAYTHHIATPSGADAQVAVPVTIENSMPDDMRLVFADILGATSAVEFARALLAWINDQRELAASAEVLAECCGRRILRRLSVEETAISAMSVKDIAAFIVNLVEEYKDIAESGNSPVFGEILMQPLWRSARSVLGLSTKIVGPGFCSYVLRLLENVDSRIISSALVKTAARRVKGRIYRARFQAGILSVTRQQILSFVLRTGQSPPSQNTDDQVHSKAVSREQCDSRGENDGNRQFRGFGIRAIVQYRHSPSVWRRPECASAHGARSLKRGQQLRGPEGASFVKTMQRSEAPRAVSYSCKGVQMDQLRMAASRLSFCAAGMNEWRGK